ncbi:MAG TPA: hypothetical protein VNU64_14480 [Burkholderiales bacterium]|nr:hypothetical protein [Burkholderiales bacterium]
MRIRQEIQALPRQIDLTAALRFLAPALALIAVAPLVAAQAYPGGAFVVENRPGAGGTVAADAVAKSKPDTGARAE